MSRLLRHATKFNLVERDVSSISSRDENQPVDHRARDLQVAGLTGLGPEMADFRHADHVFDTRPRRKDAGPVSRDPDVLCVECHKTAAGSHHLGDIHQPAAAVCLTCHTGKPGLPDVLPAVLLRPLETVR